MPWLLQNIEECYRSVLLYKDGVCVANTHIHDYNNAYVYT